MNIDRLTEDIADTLVAIDSGGIPFKAFQPGVGPYGEPQLVRQIADRMNQLPLYMSRVMTKRSPDLLISGDWAIEFKIARPFGDNGKQAENWSVNLLHPYPGNVSSISDCFKLRDLHCAERKAIFVIGYEHNPPQINLEILVRSFEVIAEQVVGIGLSKRIESRRSGLVHPVHQIVRVFAWEVLPRVG